MENSKQQSTTTSLIGYKLLSNNILSKLEDTKEIPTKEDNPEKFEVILNYEEFQNIRTTLTLLRHSISQRAIVQGDGSSYEAEKLSAIINQIKYLSRNKSRLIKNPSRFKPIEIKNTED